MCVHRSVYPRGLDLMLESSLLHMPVPEGKKQAGWKADSGDSGALSFTAVNAKTQRETSSHSGQQHMVGSLRESYPVEIQGPMRHGSGTTVMGGPSGAGC